MQKVQPRLTWVLLFTALLLLVYFGTAYLSSPIDGFYRGAAGLSTARGIAQIAALLASAALFITALIVAIPTALQPAPWFRKILSILPLYFVLLTLAGIVSALVGVGYLGNFLNIQGVGTVTFAAAWPAIGAVFATAAVVTATARLRLGQRALKFAATTTGIAVVAGLAATIAMLVSVAIVSTSQPSGFGFGGRPDGQPAGARPGTNGPTGQIQPPAGFAPPQNSSADPGGQPNQSGQIQPPAGFAPPQNPGGAGQNGQGDQRGRLGGGFGGPISPLNIASRFEAGGIAMAILAAIALVGIVSGGLGALRTKSVEPAAPSIHNRLLNYQREVRLALVSSVGLTFILVGFGQLVPVSHTNPSVQTTVNWDSAQTRDLAYRACMDCHSNETNWPWYSYVAPASWLLNMHVTEGRQQFDLSELNNLPPFRRGDLAGEMAQQIRNGAMPPADYLILHPEARLTDAEKQALIQGLQKSLAQS